MPKQYPGKTWVRFTAYHSRESALLKLYNDLLLSFDSSNCGDTLQYHGSWYISILPVLRRCCITQVHFLPQKQKRLCLHRTSFLWGPTRFHHSSHSFCLWTCFLSTSFIIQDHLLVSPSVTWRPIQYCQSHEMPWGVRWHKTSHSWLKTSLTSYLLVTQA